MTASPNTVDNNCLIVHLHLGWLRGGADVCTCDTVRIYYYWVESRVLSGKLEGQLNNQSVNYTHGWLLHILVLSFSLFLPLSPLPPPPPPPLSLFVEKLPKHPEYAKALPADRMKIKKLLKVAFPRAMELKEKLKLQYEKEKEELERKVSWCYRI